MISIQQTLSELEKTHQMRTVALDCYLAAIKNMAQYPVELDAGMTAPHSRSLENLAGEVAGASPAELVESRATLRGLLRDYRDGAARYLGTFREQLASMAQALQEMVEGLSQSDGNYTATIRTNLARVRDLAASPVAGAVRGALVAAVDSIEQSLEQIRKQQQLTVTQFQTELRLLHRRIESLETAAVLDEATRFSNRRFLMEYLGAPPQEGASLLLLKLRGVAQARGRHGAAVADDLVATFGRRLRNTLPKDLIVGRWSDQEFLAMLPAGKPVDAALCRRVQEHLSTPYATMIGGKVVRIPLEVTVEALAFPAGTPAEQVLARVSEAFE